MRIVAKETKTGVIVADRYFDDEAAYVGSQPGCALHVPDRRLGAHCLLISPDEHGVWWVEPLNADAKPMVDGQPLRERRMLADGDAITLFDHTITVHPGAEDTGQPSTEERLSPTDLAEIKKYPLPPGSFVKRKGDPVQVDPNHLARFARAALELAGCRDLALLVEAGLTHLLQGFRGRCAWIGLRRQTSGELEVISGRYASGEACEAPGLAKNLQYRCMERLQSILVRRAGEEVIGSALGVPVEGSTGGVYGMLYVDSRKGAKRLGTSDLDALLVLAAAFGRRLEALLTSQSQQVEQVNSAELHVVQGMQEQLDPASVPSWAGLQISAFSRAGQESNGDVYEVLQVPGKELAYALVASVSASGPLLPALMVQVHASFRMAAIRGEYPHAFFRHLNHVLYGNGSRYIAAFALLLDPKSGRVIHCRAGRIGAIIVDPRGEPRPFGTIEMPALGVERGFEYNASEDAIRPGETLGLYTRGVATAMNAQGERFREKRFVNCLCDSFGQKAVVALEDLKTDLAGFTDGGRHPDDMTVVLVHRPGDD